MNQPPSIFDDQFDLDLPVRRRHLLSSVLQVFLWVIMSGAVLMALGVLVMMAFTVIFPEEIAPGDDIPMLLAFAFLLVLVILVFLMTFLVWREVKWAIRFNKVILGVWAAFVGIAALAFDVAVIQLMMPMAVIFLPYWILLFRIQRKWEK